MVHGDTPPESGDVVARKMPHEKDCSNAALVEQECNLLKRLAPQANIIKVFDFHNLQREVSLVRELFDGLSLQAAVQNECKPEPASRSLFTALFNAVAHVHDLTISHPDIKPKIIPTVASSLHCATEPPTATSS